jgi:hypothetical protein
VTGEIYIVGGAAIAVAYSSDRETDDVDAVFRPKEEVRAAALTGAPAEVRRTSAGTR